MTKAQLETALRNDFLTFVRDMVKEHYETDVLPVSASELAIPCLDAEDNEKFVLIKVSIPRGTRDGKGGYDPYDGYAVAEDYALTCQERQRRKQMTKQRNRRRLPKMKPSVLKRKHLPRPTRA